MTVVVLFSGGVSFGGVGPHDPASEALSKRISSWGWGFPAFLRPMPVADGLVDASDRAHLWGFYSGIALGTPAAGERKVNVVTKTDVANTALVELGQTPISDIGEATDRARKIHAVWHIFRRRFLAIHSWNAAKRSIDIAADSAAPLVGRWDAKYRVPHDCVRPLTINGSRNEPGEEPWEIETELDDVTKYIFTNAGSPIEFQYIRDVEDVGSLGATTVWVMGLALADHVSGQFHRTAAERQLLTEKAKRELRLARSSDAMQGSPHQQTNTDLLDARRSGASRPFSFGSWTHG